MFSPFHQFQNCQKLRRSIDGLIRAHTIPNNLLLAHNRYHYTLEHKLKCAKYYAETLEEVLRNTIPPATTDGLKDLVFKVNMYVDGFFMASGSALDILAHEILIYYAIPLPRDVYFSTAREQLNANRAGDPLIARLAEPTWKQEFSSYRNALTHEVLIAAAFSTKYKYEGATVRSEIVFSLPDDPRVPFDDRTYERNENLVDYNKITLRRILSIANKIYGDISTRIDAINRLPL